MGHAVAQLVEAPRYKSKVADSIPDGVIGRTMALSLTEKSARNISWR
jgi:hypothetical protein